MLSPSARRPGECDGGRGRSGVGRRSHRAERDQDRRRRLVRGGSPEDGGGQEHRAERTNPHASLHPVQDGLLGSRSDLVIAVSAGHTCFDAVAGSWVRENLVADGPRLQSTSGWYREVDCRDRKSTRLNSSHQIISYAVFCLKKKKQ